MMKEALVLITVFLFILLVGGVELEDPCPVGYEYSPPNICWPDDVPKYEKGSELNQDTFVWIQPTNLTRIIVEEPPMPPEPINCVKPIPYCGTTAIGFYNQCDTLEWVTDKCTEQSYGYGCSNPQFPVLMEYGNRNGWTRLCCDDACESLFKPCYYGNPPPHITRCPNPSYLKALVDNCNSGQKYCGLNRIPAERLQCTNHFGVGYKRDGVCVSDPTFKSVLVTCFSDSGVCE